MQPGENIRYQKEIQSGGKKNASHSIINHLKEICGYGKRKETCGDVVEMEESDLCAGVLPPPWSSAAVTDIHVR